MTNEPHSPAPSGPQRGLWWVLSAGAALTLAMAATLEPDLRGYGTHTQLGLPPCGFQLWTGTPCPGCGLTTAFAHAVRGDLAHAASANPFGLLLFAVAVACVPVGLLAGWRGWSVDLMLERFALGRWALAVAACGVALWAVRLADAL
jgi:hypothetical protein